MIFPEVYFDSYTKLHETAMICLNSSPFHLKMTIHDITSYDMQEQVNLGSKKYFSSRQKI